MAKSKVFVASSERSSVLAAALRDELQAASYDAMLWGETGRRQKGISIDETLHNAAQQFDFALIILAKEDIIPSSQHGEISARDNCIFEAGFLTARMGRDRCLLVHSAEPENLPATLQEAISMQFTEPSDLADSAACARAMSPVVMRLKDALASEGGAAFRAYVPLLSIAELFERERPDSHGGELREGAVIVCDTQPRAGSEFALQVSDNIENGTSYHYFFHFCDETIDKVVQSLQMMLVARVDGRQNVEDFKARLDTIRAAPERILSVLSDLGRSRNMLVTLLVDAPQFCFRFHNASDPKLAKLYARYLDRGYLLWETGLAATSMWASVPKFLDESEPDRIFVPLKHYSLNKEQMKLFERALSRAVARYFPGVEAEIKRICVGTELG